LLQNANLALRRGGIVGTAPRARIASSQLPREIGALLYSGQFRTRYLKVKSDLRLGGIYLLRSWSRPIYATTPS
jgi:hypothetical protein